MHLLGNLIPRNGFRNERYPSATRNAIFTTSFTVHKPTEIRTDERANKTKRKAILLCDIDRLQAIDKRGGGLETRDLKIEWKVHTYWNMLHFCKTLLFGKFAGFVCYWCEQHVDENEYGATVEWYWQGKTEVLGEKHYTVWVVDGWMGMEQRWNDTDRGKLKYWEKNIIQRGW